MMTASLVDHLALFSRLLRSQGFKLGPAEESEALKALRVVGLEPVKMRLALKLIFCHSLEQAELFELLFDAYFLPELHRTVSQQQSLDMPSADDSGQNSSQSDAYDNESKRASDPGKASTNQQPVSFTSRQGAKPEKALDQMRAPQVHFSSQAYQQQGKLSLEIADEALLEAASLLLKRLRLGKSRRFKPMAKGTRLNFRRSLRLSLATEGDIFKPAWLGHPLRKARILLFIDASRSMANYSNTMLAFAHALSQRSARLEVFIFSTGLKRVTAAIRQAGPSQAPQLTDLGEAWGGGTLIAKSLTHFVKHYAYGMLNRDSLVMIVSDGLETGDKSQLSKAMHDIRHRAAYVIWLNPLLATEGYQPLAGGMQAALPYIDHFATVDNADSLKALAKEIWF
ncbi:MAG: VWA domain-containing protein [Deinococcales bacterium]